MTSQSVWYHAVAGNPRHSHRLSITVNGQNANHRVLNRYFHVFRVNRPAHRFEKIDALIDRRHLQHDAHIFRK